MISSIISAIIVGALGVTSTDGIDWTKLVIQVVLEAIGVSLFTGVRASLTAPGAASLITATPRLPP